MDALKQMQIAIKKYCLECSGGSETERERCKLKNCSLWQYRNGVKNERLKANGKM